MKDSSRTKGEIERLVARYRYRDKQGHLLFERLRYDPKRFESLDLDGHTVPGIPVHVLYRLPELLAANPNDQDANALATGVSTPAGESDSGWNWDIGRRISLQDGTS